MERRLTHKTRLRRVGESISMKIIPTILVVTFIASRALAADQDHPKILICAVAY